MFSGQSKRHGLVISESRNSVVLASCIDRATQSGCFPHRLVICVVSGIKICYCATKRESHGPLGQQNAMGATVDPARGNRLPCEVVQIFPRNVEFLKEKME